MIRELASFVAFVFTYGIATKLHTFAEQASVSNTWHRPVAKIKDYVSGDALAHHRWDDMPLPNVWRSPNAGR